MPNRIETKRLLLEPVAAADAAALHELWTLPDVRRYLWDNRVVSLDETADIIQRSEELFAKQGFGLWSTRERPHPQLIGFAGYWYFRDPPELELLIGLHPQRWHRGLATEAGIALMRHGFEVLGFADIAGSTDAPNATSIRLMERLGMVRQGRTTVAGLDTVFYRAAREDWKPLA